MLRSDVRHALYRMRSGVPKQGAEEVYKIVEPLIPPGESWESFSTNWDVFVKNGVIHIIKPETDYDFIHTTCLEKSMSVRYNTPITFDQRQENTIEIVELNMLEGKMSWETYSKTWSVVLDYDLKKISTRMSATSINEVTADMIANSAKSDGAAMEHTPELPNTNVDMETFTPTPEQQKMLDRLTTNKK